MNNMKDIEDPNDYSYGNSYNDGSESYFSDMNSGMIIDSADDLDDGGDSGARKHLDEDFPFFVSSADDTPASDEGNDPAYYDGSFDNIFNTESETNPDYHYVQSDEPEYQPAPQRKRTASRKRRKKGHPVRTAVLHGILVFCTVMSAFYLVAVYSNNAFITKYRNMYIQTAMATINHKYLATAIIPSDVINDLLRMQYEAEINAIGVQSDWGSVEVQALPSFSTTTTAEDNASDTAAADEAATDQAAVEINDGTDSGTGREYSSADEKTFFQRFYEIDYDSFQSYLSEHPETLDNGWANININEAGLDDEGTSIQTVYGDQVLAINASEGITLIRIYINSSRGIMAICKDTSKLSLCPASTLGSTGQTIGKICDANNGILSLTGSAFMDDGNSNGGQISGLAVCSGTEYGSRLGGTDKRIEIRNDNKMYIVDSVSEVNADTRDACEFRPALIVDGQIIVDDSCGWTSPNPRAVLGQSQYLETMMVVLEGRLSDSPGDSVVYIAEKLLQYGCVQALNLDGGTSALMYYDGEYVSRCSNTALPSGRTLPTAWVYKRY